MRYFRIADGVNRGAAGLAADERHFPDNFAGAQFGQLFCAPLPVLSYYAKPAADDNAERITRVTLLHQNFAAGNMPDFQLRLEVPKRDFVQLAEELAHMHGPEQACGSKAQRDDMHHLGNDFGELAGDGTKVRLRKLCDARLTQSADVNGAFIAGKKSQSANGFASLDRSEVPLLALGRSGRDCQLARK